MGRRTLLLLLFAPLILLATELAHALGYWLLEPDAATRASVLARSGHGYLAHAQAGFGAALALVAVGFALRTCDVRRGRTPHLTVGASWFALLPLFVFVVQEHLERFVHSGGVPWSVVLEPEFLLGLALQVPFGLLAYVLGRLLLRTAERLGGLLVRGRLRFAPAPPRWRLKPADSLLRVPVVALRAAARAPPILA